MGVARTTAIVALAFVGLAGLVGGIPLILHADGEPWWMPQSLLQYSPFRSFLIPGIILLAAIGVLSCWILWMTLQGQPGYGWWVVLQGCVLLGWLVAEMVMLRLVMWAQGSYVAVALALILSGVTLVHKPGGVLH
jgi:hypothetical protein